MTASNTKVGLHRTIPTARGDCHGLLTHQSKAFGGAHTWKSTQRTADLLVSRKW
jgi:hypothetical protein